jgi:hypothetical protein
MTIIFRALRNWVPGSFAKVRFGTKMIMLKIAGVPVSRGFKSSLPCIYIFSLTQISNNKGQGFKKMAKNLSLILYSPIMGGM